MSIDYTVKRSPQELWDLAIAWFRAVPEDRSGLDLAARIGLAVDATWIASQLQMVADAILAEAVARGVNYDAIVRRLAREGVFLPPVLAVRGPPVWARPPMLAGTASIDSVPGKQQDNGCVDPERMTWVRRSPSSAGRVWPPWRR